MGYYWVDSFVSNSTGPWHAVPSMLGSCNLHNTPRDTFQHSLCCKSEEAKHRMVKWLAQGYTARKWWGWGSNPDIQAPESVTLEGQTIKHLLEAHLWERQILYSVPHYLSFEASSSGLCRAFILTLCCLGNPTRPLLCVPILPSHFPVIKNLSVLFLSLQNSDICMLVLISKTRPDNILLETCNCS